MNYHYYYSGEVSTILKDGKILGYLANAIKPDSYKITFSSIVFKKMENIRHFIDFCEKLGVSKADLFQVVDLYLAQNIPQVINGIIGKLSSRFVFIRKGFIRKYY